MSKARAFGLILFGLSSFLVSCGDGERATKRSLLPAEEKQLDLTAETQRVRDMQKVRVLEHVLDQGQQVYVDNWMELDSSAFAFDVFYKFCIDDVIQGEYNGCRGAVAYLRGGLCVAETLLAASQVRAEPYVVRSTHDEKKFMSIPQQSHSSNAAMLRTAVRYATRLFDSDDTKLSSNGLGFYEQECQNAEGGGLGQTLPGDDRTLADIVNSVLSRVYDVGTQAAYLAVDNILAVSDAERSSSSSVTDASRRSWMETELSRLAAAQLLVGGNIPANTATLNAHCAAEPPDFPLGFCPSRALSAQAQRAVQLLRAAAPSAEALLNEEVSTKTILDGDLDNGDESGGSVAVRLAEIYRDEDLVYTQDLAGHFGLLVSDFDEARQYLQNEIRAFGRDIRETTDPGPGKKKLYTALRVAAQEAPDVFYVALAAGTGDGVTLDGEGNRNADSLAWFRKMALDGSARMSRVASSLAWPSDRPSLVADYRRIAATLAGAVKSTVLGTFRVMGVQDNFTAFYDSYTPGDDSEYRVVQGEKGLKCATAGEIEGRTCIDSELVNATRGVLSRQDPGVCPEAESCYYATSVHLGDADSHRVYLVRRPNSVAAAPGNFRVVAGAELRGSGDISGTIPGLSTDYGLVAKILRPSKSSCESPRHSCSGVSFDERLPLEDELTNDSNGVESSWKHYLDLAKQAAQESDDLGSAYVNTSLDVDKVVSEESIRLEQRREQLNALFETVQNTCGTSADPQKLLKLVLGYEGGGCGDNSDCVGAGVICSNGRCIKGTRTCDAGCGVAADCVDGICIPNLEELVQNAAVSSDLNLTKLAKCLSGGILQFVGLGDSNLCVQVSGNAYCTQGSNSTNPCPRAEPDPVHCPSSSGDVHVYVAHNGTVENSHNTELLGLFHVKSANNESSKVCDDIVTLRNLSGNTEEIKKSLKTAFEEIVNSHVFEPIAVAQAAKALGFEARVGTHSAVTFNGSPFLQTGNVRTGPSTGTMPCTGGPNGAPVADKALWSQSMDCATDEQRSVINDRWQRAVILARYVGGYANGERILIPGTSQCGNVGPNAPCSTFMLNDTYVYECSYESCNQSRVEDGSDPLPSGKYYFTEDATFGTEVAYITHEPLSGSDIVTGWPNLPVWWLAFQEYGEFGSDAGKVAAAAVDGDGRHLLVSDPLLGAPWFSGLSPALDSQNLDRVGNSWYFNQLTHLRDQLPVAEISTPSSVAQSTPIQFSSQGLLDAMELLCRARVAQTSGVRPSQADVPTVASVADLPAISVYMDSVASQIEDWASRFVIPNFPKAAADFLRQESNSGVVPALGGSYATTMTTLRADLIDLAQVAPLMAYELRQLGVAVDQARISLSQVDLTEQLQQLGYQSTMASSAATCASAAANTLGNISSFGASSAVACASAIVQGFIAAGQLNVEKQQDQLQKQSNLASFQEQLNTHAQALQSYADKISKALEGIDGMVAELERQRLEAKRALAEAVRVSSFIPTNTENIYATMAQQRETARVRYENAFKNAKLMADLAKRSIEQRLGMQLSQMTFDLPLVEAPQSWEGTVCDRSGINWEKVRSNNSDIPSNYADAFIGDYVSKLERVVESYRLQNSFHEGTDTAIISMRDDVLNVRAPCDARTKNLLTHTTDLDSLAGANGTNGWAPKACLERTDSSGVRLATKNCLFPQVLSESAAFTGASDLGSAQVFQLVQGNVTDRSACASSPDTCDYQPGAKWVQRVHLTAGTYNLSFYTPADSSEQNQVSAVVSTSTGIVISPKTDHFYYGETLQMNATSRMWQQFYGMYVIQKDGDYDVGFVPEDQSSAGVPGIVAAPMLESFPLTGGRVDWRPGQVVTSTGNNLISLRQCEDTSGEYFHQAWRLGEVPLCPAGFSGSCDSTQSTIHRYREIPFSINQRDIESGRILSKAGFAVGNFNYRIDSIGVNFVGTGVKNCTGSSSPTTCYSNGSVQYSLDHVGPYYVRNHEGGTYEAKLFTGHIEHARGLAAERYITNPISSTDQQLMSDYMRSELQGRPLDGNFVLRLWEDATASFDGIKDIQIVLKYSYWTRFD